MALREFFSMVGANPDSPNAQRRLRIGLAMLLVVVTLLLYLPVLHHDFLPRWDDNLYVTDNPHVSSGLSWENVKWAFHSSEVFYWQPLTHLSHMLDCQWFGLSSGPQHYGNVLLHAANALLLFFLLFWATGETWKSFFVAALFAWHPTNVETVAWLAERNNLLVALFTLLTVAAYGWYVRQPGEKRYAAVIALFVLALMCKPTAVILPLMLLLIDEWPLKRNVDLPFVKRWGGLLLEKAPLFAVSIGFSILTVASETDSQTMVPFSVLPLSTRLQNAILAYAAHLEKFVWPTRLSPFYPHPAMMHGLVLPWRWVLSSALLLVAVTVMLYLLRRRGGEAGKAGWLGWLFFLLILSPLIGIAQSGFQGRQDHFTYIPAIGVFIAIVWCLGALLESIPLPRAALVALSLCMLAGYAVATSRYLPHWQSSVTLFAQARLANGEPDPWIEQLYGDALLDDGRAEEALQHYKESCALGPRNEYCHFKIANILFDRHQYRDAVSEYQITLGLTRKPDVALTSLNKSAEALIQLGYVNAAQEAVTNALAIDPNDSTARELQMRLFGRRP